MLLIKKSGWENNVTSHENELKASLKDIVEGCKSKILLKLIA